MKVTIENVIAQEIDIPRDACFEIAIETVLDLIKPGEYLTTGHITGKTYLAQDDPNWRHGSVGVVKIREATTLDIAVLDVLRALRKQRNKIEN